MPHIFPVEPKEGWRAGDLAYCVSNLTQGASSPMIEKGRVYRVVKAWKPKGIAHHGLRLAGIDTGKAIGFLSNKFIRLGPAAGRLKQIDEATRYTMEHYWPEVVPPTHP